MSRSPNAQLAVEMYDALLAQHHWSATTAWHGIVLLLLSCEIWRREWGSFHGVVVHRESNDYKLTARGPNAYLRRAGDLTVYLANQLGIPRAELCARIGLYWKHPTICKLQPNNPVGHAFRSIVVDILEKFGTPGLTYAEEVSPYAEFPGQQFATRSEDPRIDIVARRGKQTVALISTRWRFRHDRVDVVEEAMAYAPAARRHNPDCQLYAVVGEFAPNRLNKIISNCPPLHSHAALSATVHFAPQLITEGLKENGRMQYLRSLQWLVEQTPSW